jgi:hypothetical protein
VATIAQATGFEIPDVNAYGSVSGATSSTTQSRGGTRSLRIAATNALCRVVATSGGTPFGFTTGTRQAVRFAVFMETMPSAEISIFALGLTTPGECFITIDNGGVLRARWIAGGVAGVGDANATLVTGRWYTIEMEWDTHTASAWVCRWRVDDHVQADATYTGSATTPSMTQVTWGNTFLAGGSGSYAFYLDDFAMSSTAGDYPIGNGYGKGYAINGTGSHVITTGAFQDDGGNAITAGDTTSHTKLEESTPDTTSYVVQTTAKNTDYLEYTFADTGSPADTPQFVRAADWKAVASAAVANGGGKLHDGTTDTSIPTTASASFHYRELRQQVRAGAQGAWTTAAIDALTYRIGFNSANPATTAVKSSFAMIEVDYAVPYSASDQAADNVTFTSTGAEALVDTGADTVTTTPASATETLADSGSDSESFTPSGAEAIADSGSDSVSFTADQSYSVVTGTTSDSGDDDLTVTPTGSEALVDQGSATLTQTTSKVREAIADSGSDTATLTPSGSTAISESQSDLAVATVSDSEAIADRGTATAAFTVTKVVEAIADSGATTVAFTAESVEETVFDGETVITLGSVTGAEAIVDQGSSTISFTAVAVVEAIADQGADQLALTADGVDAPYELGELTLSLTDSDSAALADGALVVLVLSPSGRAVRIAGRRGHLTLADSPTRRASLTVTVTTASLTDEHDGAAGLTDGPARRGSLAVTSGKLTLEDA